MFFYNVKTKESKWSLGLKARRKGKKKNKKRIIKKTKEVYQENVIKTINISPETKQAFLVNARDETNLLKPVDDTLQPQEEHEDWISVWDEKTQRQFWYNKKTEESKWTKSEQKDKSSVAAVIDNESSVAWKKLFDESSNRFFFYNSVTGVSQWNRPKLKSLIPKEPKESNNVTKIDNDWELLTDKTSGRIYFFNRKLGITQWERPAELSSQQEVEKAKNIWEEIKDPESGRIFFHNKITGVSQWHYPYEEEILDQLEQNEGNKLQDDNQAFRINNAVQTDIDQKFNLPPPVVAPEKSAQPPVVFEAPNTVTTQAQPALVTQEVPTNTQSQANVNQTNQDTDASVNTKSQFQYQPFGSQFAQPTVQSSSRNIISGYLKKRARYGLRTFLPRFFILQQITNLDQQQRFLIKYYETEELAELQPTQPLAEIDLIHNVESILEVTEKDGDYDPDYRGLDFKLVVHTSVLAYVLTLRAYNQDDFTQWLRIINKYRSLSKTLPLAPQVDLQQGKVLDQQRIALDEDRTDNKRRQFLNHRLKVKVESPRTVQAPALMSATLDLAETDEEEDEEVSPYHASAQQIEKTVEKSHERSRDLDRRREREREMERLSRRQSSSPSFTPKSRRETQPNRRNPPNRSQVDRTREIRERIQNMSFVKHHKEQQKQLEKEEQLRLRQLESDRNRRQVLESNRERYEDNRSMFGMNDEADYVYDTDYDSLDEDPNSLNNLLYTVFS